MKFLHKLNLCDIYIYISLANAFINNINNLKEDSFLSICL